MDIVLHIVAALGVAAAAWLGLFLAVAIVVNGRAWVWAQTREACAVARNRLRRRSVIGRPVPASAERTVTFTRLDGWR